MTSNGGTQPLTVRITDFRMCGIQGHHEFITSHNILSEQEKPIPNMSCHGIVSTDSTV